MADRPLVSLPWVPAVGNADARRGGLPGLVEDAVRIGVAVADEDVEAIGCLAEADAVGIARDEVGGPRRERHEASVSADARRTAGVVGVLAPRRVADPGRLAGGPVVHEDVVVARVASDQRGGLRT